MKAEILDKFLANKNKKVNIDLPYEREDLYSELKNIYYGDMFFNSPKSELERLKSKKTMLKLQRTFSTHAGKDMLSFGQDDKIKIK